MRLRLIHNLLAHVLYLVSIAFEALCARVEYWHAAAGARRQLRARRRAALRG